MTKRERAIRQLNDSEIDCVSGGTNELIQTMRSTIGTEVALESMRNVSDGLLKAVLNAWSSG